MEGKVEVAMLLGYQVADRNGHNIQGDDDPSGLASFEVMDLGTAHRFCVAHPGFLLQPILEGTIEEPTIVTRTF